MIDRDERHRKRLDTTNLTPEQCAAVEARRIERQTPEYQAELARDIDAYREEFPPIAPDEGLVEAMAALCVERERQGLSLTDLSERTGINQDTISKLETGRVPNPTLGTVRAIAHALGKRMTWKLEPMPSRAEGY